MATVRPISTVWTTGVEDHRAVIREGPGAGYFQKVMPKKPAPIRPSPTNSVEFEASSARV